MEEKVSDEMGAEILREVKLLRAELAQKSAPPSPEHWPKTVGHFAAYVHRSEDTVRRWIREGKLKANKVGDALITQAMAAAFLDGKRASQDRTFMR